MCGTGCGISAGKVCNKARRATGRNPQTFTGVFP
ncbi:hypothetical protein [Stutzerimonas balearica]